MVFVVTRKPAALAALTAVTTVSNVPARPTGRIVAFPQPVDVDDPGEVRRGPEQIELLLHEQTVGAQIDEAAAADELGRDLADLGVQQRLAAGDGDDRGAALHDGVHGGVDRHPLPQQLARILDLATAGAGQIAGEERLELEDEREPRPAPQPAVCSKWMPTPICCRTGTGTLTTLLPPALR